MAAAAIIAAVADGGGNDDNVWTVAWLVGMLMSAVLWGTFVRSVARARVCAFEAGLGEGELVVHGFGVDGG